MPSENQVIQFKYGLQTNYDLITTKDLNTLYFTTDSQRLFVGETEYTRPVQHGSSVPAGYQPPNSLFVKEVGTGRELYYSKDGASWELICKLPATITGGVFGEASDKTLAFGDSFTVPKLTVDSNGFITAGENVTITLPSDIANSVKVDGAGNAVTSASFDATGHELTLTKGETFATKEELDAVSAVANAAMPKTGGDFSGPVTVQAPTADMNPATKKYVDDAISGITDFGIDMGPDDAGYASLEALKTAHPTGEVGIFYLVQGGSGEDDNAFVEYFWTGSGYEMAGKFGAVDTSNFATKTEVAKKADKVTSATDGDLAGLDANGNLTDSGIAASTVATKTEVAAKVDKTTKVNGMTLTGDITITDITGNAGTASVADKVANKLTINGTEYDGSEAVSITTPNDNTTYTFDNGTNGSFTVTPSNGSAQTVSIGKPANATHADAAGKVDNALTLKAGTTTVEFDGSTAKEFEVTADGIGALTADSSLDASKLTGAIPAAVTAVTASAGDNSTKIATTAYADTAAANAANAVKLTWGTF